MHWQEFAVDWLVNIPDVQQSNCDLSEADDIFKYLPAIDSASFINLNPPSSFSFYEFPPFL
jgi:hypothetical protein